MGVALESAAVACIRASDWGERAMKLKFIVEKEALRAEALLAGYLGLSAGIIDLADFEVEYMKRAIPELKLSLIHI